MKERLSTPRLEAARERMRAERHRPAAAGEPMTTVQGASCGPFKIPTRYAEAQIEYDRARRQAQGLTDAG